MDQRFAVADLSPVAIVGIPSPRTRGMTQVGLCTKIIYIALCTLLSFEFLMVISVSLQAQRPASNSDTPPLIKFHPWVLEAPAEESVQIVTAKDNETAVTHEEKNAGFRKIRTALQDLRRFNSLIEMVNRDLHRTKRVLRPSVSRIRAPTSNTWTELDMPRFIRDENGFRLPEFQSRVHDFDYDPALRSRQTEFEDFSSGNHEHVFQEQRPSVMSFKIHQIFTEERRVPFGIAPSSSPFRLHLHKPSMVSHKHIVQASGPQGHPVYIRIQEFKEPFSSEKRMNPSTESSNAAHEELLSAKEEAHHNTNHHHISSEFDDPISSVASFKHDDSQSSHKSVSSSMATNVASHVHQSTVSSEASIDGSTFRSRRKRSVIRESGNFFSLLSSLSDATSTTADAASFSDDAMDDDEDPRKLDSAISEVDPSASLGLKNAPSSAIANTLRKRSEFDNGASDASDSSQISGSDSEHMKRHPHYCVKHHKGHHDEGTENVVRKGTEDVVPDESENIVKRHHGHHHPHFSVEPHGHHGHHPLREFGDIGDMEPPLSPNRQPRGQRDINQNGAAADKSLTSFQKDIKGNI